MVFNRKSAQQYSTPILPQESLLQALHRESGLSDETLAEAASKGAVWVSLARGRGKTKPRRLYSLDDPVAELASIMLNYDPQVLSQIPQSMHCVQEHKNYGIWFKPVGMLCQGSKWSDHTVATQVATNLSGHPCYLVHRLDKAASGLLLLAYTKNALRSLSLLFEQRQISKQYQAIVVGNFEQPLPTLIDEPIDGRSARSTILSAEPNRDNSLLLDRCTTLTISIDTGRKHQIRKHLSGLGFPIVGDRLYAQANTENTDQVDLQLLATHLSFDCPFTQHRIDVSLDSQFKHNTDQ